MTNHLTFSSNQQYITERTNLTLWRPLISSALRSNDIIIDDEDIIEYGDNPTYPVFLIKDYVIKFFGHLKNWNNAHKVELRAHETLIKDKCILAPQIVGYGKIFNSTDNPWPYIISKRINGKAWKESTLSFNTKENIASEIGREFLKIQQLPPPHDLSHENEWQKLDLVAAAKKSILPEHLIMQIPSFIKRVRLSDACLVNGDIVDTHVFVNNGQLSGIIDWGDAAVSDKHYELGKLMNTFDWNKDLLQAMLSAANWNIEDDFSTQALGYSIIRQAVGLTQHTSFDVFYQLPSIYPLSDIQTLEELGETLFQV